MYELPLTSGTLFRSYICELLVSESDGLRLAYFEMKLKFWLCDRALANEDDEPEALRGQHTLRLLPTVGRCMLANVKAG